MLKKNFSYVNSEEKVTCAAVNKFGIVVISDKPFSGRVKKEKAWSNRQHASPAIFSFHLLGKKLSLMRPQAGDPGSNLGAPTTSCHIKFFNLGDASPSGHYEPSPGCGD